jgi:hypothetical protein
MAVPLAGWCCLIAPQAGDQAIKEADVQVLV